jgi:tripartite-type tricarboxylate transporter receptor subunit TctC
MIASNNAWNVALYDNLNFDFIRDIAPIASIYRGSGVLVVHPSFPVKSVPDLIAHSRANPGKINMASGGVGSAQHVYGELFKMMTGVTCCTCRIGAEARPSPICSPAKCTSCSTRWRPRSSTSGRASCALWQ